MSVKLGQTPLDLEVPLAQGTAVFGLKLDGYHDATAELAADRDGEVSVALDKKKKKRPGKPDKPRNNNDPLDPFGG